MGYFFLLLLSCIFAKKNCSIFLWFSHSFFSSLYPTKFCIRGCRAWFIFVIFVFLFPNSFHSLQFFFSLFICFFFKNCEEKKEFEIYSDGVCSGDFLSSRKKIVFSICYSPLSCLEYIVLEQMIEFLYFSNVTNVVHR